MSIISSFHWQQRAITAERRLESMVIAEKARSENLITLTKSLLESQAESEQLRSKLKEAKKSHYALLEWLREKESLADKCSAEWAKENPNYNQAAYRSGMWFAFRMVEIKLQAEGNKE